ncbi:hypothetical protein FE257_007918 [Aspergillus nanangensis]|uniref:FAD/NAD(P)-binding domain-containing protein n=1 Tax=Aspergillus nanangensis TaxID=2582783 RepID=A0AAD4GZ60_ASPNN|nr:hypothetical protein FE257_007918 [Aspergillus nanangensis]
MDNPPETSPPPTSVVIIGGSNAGLGVSHALLKDLLPHAAIQVTLINPSSEYYFNIAAPRVLAYPANDPWSIPEDKYIYSIPTLFQAYPPDAFRFVEGSAERVDPVAKTVTVTLKGNSEVLKYDYLVIASGSTTASTIGKHSFQAPFKPPQPRGGGNGNGNGNDAGGDLRALIANTQAALRRAKSVIVGGAGPVGVEFIAELAEAFARRSPEEAVSEEKGVELTLLSSTAQILPLLPPKSQSAALLALETKGILVKTNSSVSSAEFHPTRNNWSVALSSGETLVADVYISATGCIPNNQFIPREWLDAQGWVDVDETLRVVENGESPCVGVYALGDISSHAARVLMRVPPQVATVVAGIKGEVLQEEAAVVPPYLAKAQWDMMFVPVGRYTGTGRVEGYTLWGWMVALVKGRDFLVGRVMAYIGG